MALHFTGIGHIALRCKDYDEMYRYYTEKLGLEKAFDLKDENGEVWITYLTVQKGRQYIELFRKTKDRTYEKYVGDNRKCNRSNFHACFETQERHPIIDLLESRGLTVGRTPDDSTGLCGSYCQFVTDPEGNEWEIMEFTDKSLQIVSDQ